MQRQVYDLRKEGVEFRPLPISKRRLGLLQTAVLDVIRKVPGGASAVLSTYHDDPVVWDLPPLYFGTLKSVPLSVGLEGLVGQNYNFSKDFDRLVGSLMAGGWSAKFQEMFERRTGSAVHPSSFTIGANLKRFVLEYVVAVSTATGREIVANDNNFAVKVFNGADAEYIGVVSNKIRGTDVSFSAAEIYDEILMPQGAVTTKTYGAYDRALRWAESSFEFDVEDVDKLRVALALLKLSSDHTQPFCEREALFAQKLREVPLKELKGPKRGSKLDYDMFSEVRTIWLSQGLYSAEECFQKMMDKLVPDVYDSRNFKRIFGMLPQPGNELLTRKQLSRIDRGMEMFTKEFASLKEY